MGRLVTGIFSLVVLIIIGLLIAPFLIPASAYKDQIVQSAREATGRDVTFSDDMGLALFPQAKVTLSDVLISNASQGKASYLAKIGHLDVGVDLFSFFSGNLKIDRFVLQDADIHLEAYKDGSANWEFESKPAVIADTTDSATPEQPPSAPTEREPAKQSPEKQSRSIENVLLGDIRIENSNIRFTDASGVQENYSDINLIIGLDDLDSPLRVDGSLTYRKEPVTLDLYIEHPRAFVSGGETQADVDFQSSLAKVKFYGISTLNPDSKNLVSGTLSADISSVREFAAFLGNPIGGQGGFGPLKFKSQLDAKGDSVVFKDVDIAFDGMKGDGTLSLSLNQERPRVTGTLNVDHLDFNKFIVSNETAKGGPTSAPLSLDDELVLAQAKTWSNSPLNFDALKSFDARLNLTAEKVRFRDIKIGKSSLNINQTAGKMTANIAESPLYSGLGKGQVIVNAGSSVPVITSRFELNGAQMLPFLTDALGFDKIEGQGFLTYELSSQGRSMRALINNLNGSGHIKVLDGAYRGVNLANMARAIDSFVSLGLSQDKQAEGDEAGQENVGQGQKTDFAELSGTYHIQNGIVSNNDLAMLNPFIRVTGAGTVNLPRQTIQYRLTPKVVKSIQGQGGDFLKSGISVPIIVEGPLDNPRFEPDLGAAIGSAILGTPGSNEPAPLQKIIEKALGVEKEKTADPSDGGGIAPSTDSDTTPAPVEKDPDPVDLLFQILKDAQKDSQ